MFTITRMTNCCGCFIVVVVVWMHAAAMVNVLAIRALAIPAGNLKDPLHFVAFHFHKGFKSCEKFKNLADVLIYWCRVVLVKGGQRKFRNRKLFSSIWDEPLTWETIGIEILIMFKGILLKNYHRYWKRS